MIRTVLGFMLVTVVCIALSGCAGSTAKSVTATTVANATLCSLCQKPITVDTAVKVAIGTAAPKAYRCIHCALTAVREEPADLIISARTRTSGTEVRLRRSHGAWTADPPTTVFLILPERANECLDLHQPFTDRAAFDAYLAAHPDIAAQHPRAFRIDEYEALLKAGSPSPS